MPLWIVRNKLIIIFFNKWGKLHVHVLHCVYVAGQISFTCNVNFYLQCTFGCLNSLCLLALEHKEIENQFGLKTFTCTCTYSKVVFKNNSHNFIFVSINNR